MDCIRCKPSRLSGIVRIPPSKSVAHRAVISSFLSKKSCCISPIEYSDDINATLNGIASMGGVTDKKKGNLKIAPPVNYQKKAEIDCNESGSTLRFLIPVAAALGINARFVGRGRLPKRPLDTYFRILPELGIECIYGSDCLPLEIRGRLKSGRITVPGNISSQYISGLLMALPLVEGDSEIILATPLESKGYVDLTIKILEDFGITIESFDRGYFIKGGQSYKKQDYKVEGDWSQAGFFLAAGALGSELRLEGLDKDSCQGDKEAEQLFRRMGAFVHWRDDVLEVRSGGLKAIEIQASQIPDLVPALAVTAAFAEGITRIIDAGRLRIKESDRLRAVAAGINAIGGRAEEVEDGLIIHGSGGKRLEGGYVEGFGDHRIVMAFAIAALNCEREVTISDFSSINKSYPSFFEVYNSLGGRSNVISMGE